MNLIRTLCGCVVPARWLTEGTALPLFRPKKPALGCCRSSWTAVPGADAVGQPGGGHQDSEHLSHVRSPSKASTPQGRRNLWDTGKPKMVRKLQDEPLKTLQQLLGKHGLHDFKFGNNKAQLSGECSSWTAKSRPSRNCRNLCRKP